MKNILLLLGSLGVFIFSASGQVLVPGVVFSYDAVGNRILRKMEMICIGCKPAPTDSVKGEEINPVTSELILLEAYPNPTLDALSIVNHNWKENDKADVIALDLTGKVMSKTEFFGARGGMHFGNVAAGSYLVQYVLNGVLLKTWKIVKI